LVQAQRVQGAATHPRTSIVPHVSLSGPSWTTALTGVWDCKHGVTDNNFDATPFAEYPTVFTRLARADRGLTSVSVATWDKIAIITGSGDRHADVILSTPPVPFDPDESKADAATGTAAIDLITHNAPDFLFVLLDQVDFAGHRHGGASQQYLDATMRADAQVGRIVAAVDARAAARPSERWTIVATTDHGHLPEGGHGGQTRDETAIFVIARGPDFAAGVTDAHYSLVDVTPTVLDLLGVPLPRGLDGIPMRERPLLSAKW
jgi:hypothetical protein